MAQILSLSVPFAVTLGILFSWQAKKKKIDRQKHWEEGRVTVMHNLRTAQQGSSSTDPNLIRIPKIAE